MGKKFKRVNGLTSKQRTYLKALQKRLGNVTFASNDTGINRCNHYFWYKNDEEYKRAYDELEDASIDFVEAKMFEGINAGNPTLIKYYMETKGKRRGYGKPNQVDAPEPDEAAPLSLEQMYANFLPVIPKSLPG